MKKTSVGLKEKQRELALFLLRLASGQEKNVKKGKNLRREIAQMLTLAREKELKQK
jgi:ribosomal protein L29